MRETGNQFFDNLPNDKKEKFKILFEDKSGWDVELQTRNKSNSKIILFNESLKIFIEANKKHYSIHPHISYGNNLIPTHIFFDYIEFIGIDKENMNSIQKIIKYNKETNISFQYSKFHTPISLSNIDLNKCNFSNAVFYNDVDMSYSRNLHISLCNFHSSLNLTKSKISESLDTKTLIQYATNVNFSECEFEKQFKLSIDKGNGYHGNLNFTNCTFRDNLIISNINHEYDIDFTNATFDKKLSIRESNIKSINLSGVNVNNFYFNKMQISKYDNKESITFIKNYFEKQGNITEANKYFVIEQEKYIEEIKESTTEDNKIKKLIPLYFSKLVSNFGTDWIRGILLLLIIGILGYSIFNIVKINGVVFNFNLFLVLLLLLLGYYLTFINTRLKPINAFFVSFVLVVCMLYALSVDMTYYVSFESFKCNFTHINNVIKMINPINAFKDDETFKGYEAIGVLVRIVSATIIYQIIVAFRQFTRRG